MGRKERIIRRAQIKAGSLAGQTSNAHRHTFDADANFESSDAGKSVLSGRGGDDEEEDAVLDLLVIGAGPHALSLLTRLVDDDPDLLTETERSKLMINEGTRARARSVVQNHLKKRFDAAKKLPRTVVVDSNGEWMAQWAADFKALGITHLRSHYHMHPCPFDFQSLRWWAEEQRREGDLKQMEHVDRDACRKSGYYGPFVVPSSHLFLDFCESLVDRYGLAPLLRRGTVEDVRIITDHSLTKPDANNARMFEVRLSDGRRLTARRVVCAMGPGPAFQGMRTTRPWWAEELATSLSKDLLTDCASLRSATSSPLGIEEHPGDELGDRGEDARTSSPPRDDYGDEDDGSRTSGCTCTSTLADAQTPALATPTIAGSARMQHSSTLTKWLLKRGNEGVLTGRRVLVVGGGQTAAHLAQLALHRGASSVTLSSRRRITQKLYDVDLELAGDRRSNVLRKFWHLKEPGERLGFNQALRGGGSMSSDVYSGLRKCAPSRLVLAEETEVVQACWSPAVEPSSEGEIHVRFDNGRLAHFDFVWLATGGNFDLGLVPLFASLQSQHPIACVDGLPDLRRDLSWAEGVPIYVMGAFAQLQLGADALNLAGARSGGAIVAQALLASSSK